MNEKALNAFVSRKAEIDEMLSRLVELSGNHFGVDPDDVHWGHCGDLGRIVEKLNEIMTTHAV